MIAFEIPRELEELRDRVLDFVRTQVVPFETDPRQGPHGPDDALRRELNALARAEGLLSLAAPAEFGGMGLDHRGIAVVFEAAGWSPLGPLALNIQAPDEGNVHLLDRIASPAQRARWLAPLARAEIRSVFSMTETSDGGAGADPSLLRTVAREDGDGYVIDGRKYMITGVPGAAFNIVMARTIDVAGHDLGASMFVVDCDAPGFRVVRMIESLDQVSVGGHAEVTFEGVRVPRDRLLGQIGHGLRNAQVRLGPARLTHCARWLGAATRCHAIAAAHAGRRKSFGRTLGEHQGVGFMLADNQIDLHVCRLVTWQAAWKLDQGDPARDETSMSKVFCSERLAAVVDRSLQVLGSIGISGDTVIQRTWRDIRAFRIYDGPSEVHRHALARRVVSRDHLAA